MIKLFFFLLHEEFSFVAKKMDEFSYASLETFPLFAHDWRKA